MGRALVTPASVRPGMLYHRHRHRRRHRSCRTTSTCTPPWCRAGKYQKDDASIRAAIRLNTIDSTVALTVAFFVNAAILVLAAMVFHGKDSVVVAGGEVVPFSGTPTGSGSPTSPWRRCWGPPRRALLFAVALLAAGRAAPSPARWPARW